MAGMLIFGNDKHVRGCWIELSSAKYSTTVGRGAYLTLSGQDLPIAGKEPYFVTGITLGQREKYSVVQCFQDRNYTYAFGHDPASSILEVSFIAFLTNKTGTAFGQSLQKLMGAYKAGRVSQNQQYGILTLDSCTIKGFLIGMQTSTSDPEHNLQQFTALLLCVEAQGGS